ncbi:helix-turn-helix domain-containing protein [Sporosarcina ureilytica]|uniref:DNA-binding protein n=1 Tax=Sporosarcina ureilytica TaxID=298596 RepID=A0A1D8JG91_9BACL|nr:helix-turn-helix domain-containing protein [Sporosarcina ureilytica]AOV07718.1 DNA-binding protein [Sporosarcina ureilytica]
MSSKGERKNFGVMLKNLLEERSMSMRKLSELTEIDTATISRIINGKRNANLQHLKKIADSLDVPISELITDSSQSIEQEKTATHENINDLIDTIQSCLMTSNTYEDGFSIDRVEKELKNYEQFSQTEEGKHLILNRFNEKLQNLDSIGPFINQLKELHDIYVTKNVQPSKLLLIGSALIYFIMPVDVIPDYIFPIGYLDDAIAVKLVANQLLQKNN